MAYGLKASSCDPLTNEKMISRLCNGDTSVSSANAQVLFKLGNSKGQTNKQR